VWPAERWGRWHGLCRLWLCPPEIGMRGRETEQVLSSCFTRPGAQFQFKVLSVGISYVSFLLWLRPNSSILYIVNKYACALLSYCKPENLWYKVCVCVVFCSTYITKCKDIVLMQCFPPRFCQQSIFISSKANWGIQNRQGLSLDAVYSRLDAYLSSFVSSQRL
jgi:hypothetical protein